MTSDKTTTLATPQCHSCTHFPVPSRPVAPCAARGYLVVPSIGVDKDVVVKAKSPVLDVG